MRIAVRALGVVLIGLAAVAGAQAAWIPAKAAIAQQLLEEAWRRTQRGDERPVPWPWADAWPVARLVAPTRGEALIVLSDASGRSLAFAPGHLSGTARPGGPGTSVVAGHRDTHFAFLRDLAPGDPLLVETRDGETVHYRVVETAVVEARDARVAAETGVDRLALVTCWPFDAVRPGTDLRYAVLAERGPAQAAEPAASVGRGKAQSPILDRTISPSRRGISLKMPSEATARGSRT